MATVRIRLGMYSSMIVDTEAGADSYAWPGGYPIVYYTDDGDILCANCTTEQLRTNAEPDAIICTGERIIGADVLEGSALDHGIVTCANCNETIMELDSDEWECNACGTVNTVDTTICTNCKTRQ